MGIQEAVILCLRNYVTVDGRATRPEYWWWNLFVVAVWVIVWVFVGIILDPDSGAGSVAGGLFLTVAFLPSFAVAVRRLHDTDRNGWWLLIIVVPIIGWGGLIYLFTLPGTPGPNRYGAGSPMLGLL